MPPPKVDVYKHFLDAMLSNTDCVNVLHLDEENEQPDAQE